MVETCVIQSLISGPLGIPSFSRRPFSFVSFLNKLLAYCLNALFRFCTTKNVLINLKHGSLEDECRKGCISISLKLNIFIQILLHTHTHTHARARAHTTIDVNSLAETISCQEIHKEKKRRYSYRTPCVCHATTLSFSQVSSPPHVSPSSHTLVYLLAKKSGASLFSSFLSTSLFFPSQ